MNTPNLDALMQGCVSGRFSEWPGVRQEAINLKLAFSTQASEIEQLHTQLVERDAAIQIQLELIRVQDDDLAACQEKLAAAEKNAYTRVAEALYATGEDWNNGPLQCVTASIQGWVENPAVIPDDNAGLKSKLGPQPGGV